MLHLQTNRLTSMRIIHCALAAALFFAFPWGCAEQQPAVNRVEAYAMPKTLFTGEWFYQQTVVDTPGSKTVTFEGETAFMGTHRIRWDAQEKFLYARAAYEKVKGAKNMSQDTGEYMGEIVGAWAITSHFDIKRGYNATTGEENNVLEENASDCKWYDCKYMRVDWSRNLTIDFYFLDWDESINKEAVPFYVQDNDPRFKPIFDQTAGYVDVTTAMAVAPGSIYYPPYGTFPYCWFFEAQDASCNTEIVKVRNSFWRRDPNRDYEPRLNKGKKDNWFGYFNTDRWTWYPEQGITYPTKTQFLQRHDLWVKSHYEDKACTEDKNCTEAGSRCDIYLPFHKFDVATDSDFDGLPDAFEDAMDKDGKKLRDLSASSADSNGNGLPDGQDDADQNGTRDVEDFWAWDDSNTNFRCTIPMAKREPKPVVYFNTGRFPWSLVCDEHNADPAKDDVHPCKQWDWTGDQKVREAKWSPLHHAHETYSRTFWRIYLRGAYGWTNAEYEGWITKHSPGAKAADLKKFGNDKYGYYSFALCANNPVEAEDPWPCRFPRHSFAQAEELMGLGLTYNHLSYKQAKKLLEDNKDIDQSKPVVRVGDIRYSNVHYAKDYSSVSPLGYGPSAFDPRTGEILSGFANIYSYVDYYATYMQEIVDLLNGKTKPGEYINGLDLSKWLANMKIQSQTKGAQSGGASTSPTRVQRVVSPTELSAMYQAMEQPWMKKIPKLGTAKAFEFMESPDGNQMNNRQIKQKLLGELAHSGVFDPTKAPIQDLSLLKGTQLEKRMIDNEILMASGFMPSGPFATMPQGLSEDVMNQASLARGGFIEQLDLREQFRMDLSNRKSILFADMVDEGAASLAYRLAKMAPDKVWNMARKLITRPVLEHEMGHTVGLMHNFGGSDDALNYHPDYWKVRTNDYQETGVCNYKAPKATDLCPYFIKPKNDYQLGQDQKNLTQNIHGQEDYAYASIMDYDRWPTLMGSGLGRYDDAAMMYGYGDKVEVFKEKGNIPDGTGGSANVFEEWWDSDGSVLMLYSNRAQAFHYTNWYTQMKHPSGDPARHLAVSEDNRKLVDYKDIVEEINQYGRSDGWYYKNGNEKLVRVPYIYCSHSGVNISESCMTWDFGADQYERMAMHVNEWDTWYVLNAFTRGRYYRSPGQYVSKRYSRFYKRLKNFNNLYALYQGLFHQWYNDQQIQDFFTDPVNGWGAYTVAMHDAFNVAIGTLAMPDVKGFKDKAAEADGQVIYSESVWSNEELFETDITNGRYFTTSWNDTNYNRECGYEWWECLHHMGFYLDKIMSLLILSNPQTYFVARDTAEDIRQWRISFFDNYTSQIIDFFGGLLSEDYDAIAPWFDPTKPRDKTVMENGVEWRNGMAMRNYAVPSLDAKKPAQGAAVEAATRFTLQLYAAVLGMLRFQNNFDNEFSERSRLWKKGKGTGWTVKPTEKVDGVTEFDDPFTGTTYVGVAYKDARGIAQRMVKHANVLKSRTKYCSTVVGAPDECQSVSANDQQRAESALYEYRQLMDTVIQVTTMYDTFVGNWSWDPFDP